MSLRNWQFKVVTSLRGAWSRLDLVKAKANRASIAQNVRFPPGIVTTRDGLAARLAVASGVTSIYNWITSGKNQVVYMEGTAIKALNIATAVITTLYTVSSGRAAVVAEAASRAFVAVFNTSGLGQTEAHILLSGIGSYPEDKAFAGPMVVTSLVATEPSAGTVTAGTHKFGFIMQSRSGFAGKPSPVVGDVFTPTSFASAGALIVRLTLTSNPPIDADLAYPIMTRADNPNVWYFIPGGVNGGDPNGFLGGTIGQVFHWDIDITDEDLAARATVVDFNFDYATQNSSGVGPFSPGFVKPYGQRVAYIADTDLWISDPQDHQALTSAQHKLQMPGQRRMITALVIRGILYPIGPTWTYAVSDNGDTPKTWGPPQVVSGAIGTLAPLGVTDRTAGDYGWVAAQAGLFLFSGAYEEKPITYLCAEWSRINWSAAYAVQVIDDFVDQKCYVAVPLDGATEPSHLLVIDYAKGLTPYDVDISIDTFDAAAIPSGLFSSIAMVQESNNKSLLWIGPSSAGNIMNPVVEQRNDSGAGIDSIYETGQVLDEGDSLQSSRVARLQSSVKGSGALATTVYGQDRVKSVASTATLSATPGQDVEVQFDLSDVDNFSVRFRTHLPGEWFELSKVKPWWRGMWTNR